jgi:hypothetical protein
MAWSGLMGHDHLPQLPNPVVSIQWRKIVNKNNVLQ